MMQLIRNLLAELLRGEAQRDPYTWSAAMVGHCWVGVGLWGIVAITLDRWTAVYLTPPLYLVLIEGTQLWLAGRITAGAIWDAILDTTAVTLGCVAAASLADQDILMASAAWSASMVVASAGWLTRDRG